MTREPVFAAPRWRNPKVRKPTTLHDEPRNLRERVGLWLARRVVAEYQDELAAWISRANDGWAEVVELRNGRGNPPARRGASSQGADDG